MTRDGARPVRDPLRNRTHDAVFLAYHSVADCGPAWSSVPVEQFERHLHLLARWGYRGVGGARAASARRRPPPRAAVGVSDLRRRVRRQRHHGRTPPARPRLVGAGVPPPPAVDSGAAFDWPEIQPRREAHPEVMRSLDWPAVESMAEAGIEFGSHTNRHLHLPALGDDELRDEAARLPPPDHGAARRLRLARLSLRRVEPPAWPLPARDAGIASRSRSRARARPRRTCCRSRGSPSTTATTAAASRSSSRRSAAGCCSRRPGPGPDTVRRRGYVVAERRPAA